MQKKLTEKQVNKLIKAAEVLLETVGECEALSTLDKMITNQTSDGLPDCTSKEARYKEAIETFLKESSWNRYKTRNLKSVEIHFSDGRMPVMCGTTTFMALEAALEE
jgi:hypothetical protein